MLFTVNNLTGCRVLQVIGSPGARFLPASASVRPLSPPAQQPVRADPGLQVAGALHLSVAELADALIDLPFAMPTAVSCIALCAIFAPNGG